MIRDSASITAGLPRSGRKCISSRSTTSMCCVGRAVRPSNTRSLAITAPFIHRWNMESIISLLNTINVAAARKVVAKPKREMSSTFNKNEMATITNADPNSAPKARRTATDRLSSASTDCASRAIESMRKTGKAMTNNEAPPASSHTASLTSCAIKYPLTSARQSRLIERP